MLPYKLAVIVGAVCTAWRETSGPRFWKQYFVRDFGNSRFLSASWCRRYKMCLQRMRGSVFLESFFQGWMLAMGLDPKILLKDKALWYKNSIHANTLIGHAIFSGQLELYRNIQVGFVLLPSLCNC